jgi:hypothetical protein
VIALCQAGGICRTPDERKLSFTVPAAPWTLTLPAGDFVTSQKQIKPDGRYGYFHIVDDAKQLNVSMFIEPVGNCKDSKSCRDMVWKMGNPAWVNPQNIVLTEIGEISIFEFLIPTFRDLPIQQQNLYAQFVVEGFWVDVHISKVLYKPQEHDLFVRLIKSIKFEPKNSKT